MEYIIERLSANNITRLKPLFLEVFRQRVTNNFLRTKYNTTPFGVEYLGYLAFDPNDIAVAFYGVIPCHLVIDKQTVLAAQSADTMTHPAHRGKALFTTLAEKTYALAREQGVQLVFGFPNQNSLPGFQKLGWKFMSDDLQMFKVNVNSIPYVRLINQLKIVRNLYLSSLQLIFKTPVTGWVFADKDINGVKRDTNFLNYKTYNKTFVAELDQVKIWFRPDGHLKIGDVDGLTELNAPAFMTLVKSFAARLGCNDVMFMTSKDSRLYKALKPHTPSSNAFPIGYIQLTLQAPSFSNISFEYCDLDIF